MKTTLKTYGRRNVRTLTKQNTLWSDSASSTSGASDNEHESSTVIHNNNNSKRFWNTGFKGWSYSGSVKDGNLVQSPNRSKYEVVKSSGSSNCGESRKSEDTLHEEEAVGDESVATPSKTKKIWKEFTDSPIIQKLNTIFKSPAPSSPFKPRGNDDNNNNFTSPVKMNYDIDAAVRQMNRLSISGERTIALDKLLDVCNQTDPIEWNRFMSEKELSHAEKIGEATYSEVFSLPLSYLPTKFNVVKRKGRSRKADMEKQVVMKIIPFGNTTVPVNDAAQPTVADVYNEVKITCACGLDDEKKDCLKKLCSGFIGVYGVAVCQGTYPSSLLTEWDQWNEENESENTRPDFFPENQLYCVLFLEHGGSDLEHISLDSFQAGWTVLVQVIASLAIAERVLKFEHRDLHWGNVLVQSCERNFVEYRFPSDESNAEEKEKDMRVQIPTFGVEVRVIDYTLSRLEKDSELFFTTMDDEAYFNGEGDYQFDVYRLMREEIMGKRASSWKEYCPKTNVFWLHYLAQKIVEEMDIPMDMKRMGKKDKACLGKMKAFIERVLEYESVGEILRNRDDILSECLE